jgi:hypothetical protein
MTEPSALLRARLIDAVGEPVAKPALLLSGGADSGDQPSLDTITAKVPRRAV